VNRVVFTYSNLVGSKLIRAVTGEPVSHCAIILTNGNVVHSTINGSVITNLSDFSKSNTIVLDVPIPANLPITVDFARNRRYDWGAFLYLGLRLALRKVGIRLPKKNLWQTSGMYLCTELVSQAVLNAETELTPMGLYYKLRSNYVQ
jgi:hypothetical protein